MFLTLNFMKFDFIIKTITYNIEFYIIQNYGEYRKQGIRTNIKYHFNNDKIFNFNKFGKSYGFNECPAYGKHYNNCGKHKHFAVKWGNIVDKGQLHEVQINTNKDEEKEVTYLTLNRIETEKHKNWIDTVLINDKKEFKIKLDIGAQLNRG